MNNLSGNSLDAIQQATRMRADESEPVLNTDQAAIEAYARLVSDTQARQTKVLNVDLYTGDMPGRLLALQNDMNKLSIDVALQSTLVRKVVGLVETLVKS